MRRSRSSTGNALALSQQIRCCYHRLGRRGSLKSSALEHNFGLADMSKADHGAFMPSTSVDASTVERHGMGNVEVKDNSNHQFQSFVPQNEKPNLVCLASCSRDGLEARVVASRSETSRRELHCPSNGIWCAWKK